MMVAWRLVWGKKEGKSFFFFFFEEVEVRKRLFF